MRCINTLATVLQALCVLCLMVGCAGHAPPGGPTAARPDVARSPARGRPASPPSIGRLASGSEQLEPLARPVSVKDLMPRHLLRGRTARSSGDEAPRVRPFELKPVNHGWMLTIPKVQRVFYRLSPRGDLVVPWEEDFAEDARVEYDPPMVVLPARLTAGAQRHGKVRMVVKSLDGQKTRDSGTNTYHLQVVGRHKLATRAGAFNAYLTRMRRTIDLGLANVDVTIFSAFASGEGEVAETAHRRTRALGLFSSTSDSRFERVK